MREQRTENREQKGDRATVRCSLFAVRRRATPLASRGVTTILVVAFMAVFVLLMSGLTGYVFEQAKYGRALLAREQALHVAEAGLEYYKWFLAHNPSIMQSGSGLVSPYAYTVNDPEGGTVGAATITAVPQLQCGKPQWLDITARGTSNSDPLFPRTVDVRYMKPSVAEYAFITNSAVWYISAVTGPVHANVGVRMDGTNNSTVSAAQSTWSCTPSYGCASPSETKPGVFGAGSGSVLWSYPVATVDFARIAADFPTLKSYAQATGIVLNPTFVTLAGVQQGPTFPSVGGTDQLGFHLVFKPNHLIDVYRVTGTYRIASYNTARGYLFGSNYCSYLQWYNQTYRPTPPYVCEYAYDYPDIASETLVANNISIPSSCSFIYSQAKTWISGTVSGKVTLVAADTGSYNPDIIIGGTTNINDGNIAYETTDGTTGLTAIAERSVHTAHKVPDQMSIRGTYIAQSGYFGRDYYYYDYNVDPYYGGPLSPYRLRTLLTTNGTIVSAVQVGTAYGSPPVSGFQNRVTVYDRMQAFTPPPFTPSAYADYGYKLWQEQQ